MKTFSRSLFALALALAACGISEDIATESQDIVGGYVESGHLEIVRLTAIDPVLGVEYCTGSLITSRIVLTAAHCVLDGKNNRYQSITVDGEGREYDRELGRWFPSPFSMSTGDIVRHGDYGVPGEYYNDIALVVLPQPVLGVTPARLATAVWSGLPFTMFGFGATTRAADGSYPGYGEAKRFGYNRVGDQPPYAELFPHVYSFTGAGGATLCFGDSGGPSYAGGHGSTCQIGVHHKGSQTCDGTQSWDSRVDAGYTTHQWIRDQVASRGGTVGTCAP